MEFLALLSNRDEAVIRDIRKALGRYTVYPLKTVEELEELYRNIPLSLLIIDTLPGRLSSVEGLLNMTADDMVVIITEHGPAARFAASDLPPSVFDCIAADSAAQELPRVVERALEKQRVKREPGLLKHSGAGKVMPDAAPLHNTGGEVGQAHGRRPAEGKHAGIKIITGFARMLSVNFDMRRLFDYFMDSVMEIARAGRMSVMLRDKEGFRLRRHHGLDPHTAENLVLPRDSALVSLLKKTGRIVHRPAPSDAASADLGREMDMLQCVVSFPMIHRGKLTGIFNIDRKITGEPFYADEQEMIYVLCNYLAAAVKDIDLYHQIRYQKEFTNNILSSMSSGMIAVDRDQRITVFNQRAAEILNLKPSDIVGCDSRELPSPLGDILCKTMISGTTFKRHEAVINPSKLPLGINSFRLVDEQGEPAGAGIIFSDLSDTKELEERGRREEKLRAVNNLVAKIAHEIRNPLTSIQTYTQLLNEKFTDDELKEFFTRSVSQSINRLDNLIEKLITFSSTQDYNFREEGVNDLLCEAAEFISRNIPETHRFSVKMFNRPFYVHADKKQLIKAIYYLVLNIVDRTPGGTHITMSAGTIMGEVLSAVISIKYRGGQSMDRGKKTFPRQLTDINNLGAELNVPISHKIIEGHNGNLDAKSESSTSSFIIRLPVVEKKMRYGFN
ncbi:MAG: PAS domain-containing protein [Deferribacteres bacterium]|nr:PAS domain-containing protein [Deferribacteres bacterium]